MFNSLINAMALYTADAAATGATDPAQGGCGGSYTLLIMYVLIFAGLYFFMIRPNSKKKKQEEELKKNISIGDDITTIGGITGVVVNVKDSKIVLETGADQVRIELEKWAISSNETAAENAKAEAKKAQEAKAKAKAAKKAEKN